MVLAFGASIEARSALVGNDTQDQKEHKKADKKAHDKKSKGSGWHSTGVFKSNRDKKPVVVSEEEKAYKRDLYFEVDLGMVKYSMFKCHLVNAAGLTDTIQLAHAAVVPIIRGGIGADFKNIRSFSDKDKTTNARLGIDVSYTKKTDGIRTLYTKVGKTTTENLIGKQTMSCGELMLVGSYDMWKDHFGLQGGVGVVGGALKSLRLYQNPVVVQDQRVVEVGPGYVYTGERLEPRSANPGGFIGAKLAHRFEKAKDLRFEIAYRAVFSAVKYHRTIYQDQPDSGASSQYQTAYLQTQYGMSAELPVAPSIKICANELTLGVVIDF